MYDNPQARFAQSPTQVAPPDLRPRRPTTPPSQPPADEMCFDTETGTFVGGPYHGKQAPAGTWGLSDDGQTVFVNIGGDVTSELPACPRTPPPEQKQPPELPPECCVHVLTDNLAQISASSPARGRTDCPSFPQYHEVDVAVLEVRPDGKGGMEASIVGPFDPTGGSRQRVWPVCSVGDQEREPVDCCIVAGERGQYVKCKDPSRPPHGMLAEEAIAAGYTLEMCPPPPSLPSCCVELGDYGNGNNGRLVCDDPAHPIHHRPVQVEVSPDGTLAGLTLTLGDHVYQIEFPVCMEEEVPEEVPCCIRDGKLECPDYPDYHGMDYGQYQEMMKPKGPCFDTKTGTFVGGPYDGKQAPAGTWSVSDDGTIVVVSIGGDVTSELPVCRTPQLERCPEIPPPPPPPPDCCVQETERGLFLVCTDPDSPYHGYELQPGEFNCYDTQQGRICEVKLGVQPTEPCFDVETGTFVGGPYDGKQAPEGTWTVSQDGTKVIVSIGGDVTSELPVCGPQTFRFPVCPPPPPPPPPRCCYDVATGTLICQADPDHEWNNLKVSLENMVSQNGSMVAVVSHAALGSAPITVPVCEVEIPPDCCFEAAEFKAGSVGQLVCPNAPGLDGTPATLTDVNTMPDGSLIGTVAWAGGGGRMPFCRPPCPECPECPPPYFCCVNIDNGTFVCPANTDRHGTQADIVGVEDVGGMPFVRLGDKSLVPACGSQCPAPEPCPECPSCDPCPVCPECPDQPPPPPPRGRDEDCEPCSQPPVGRFPGQPVGHVPASPSCGPQSCDQPPTGQFPGQPVGHVPVSPACGPQSCDQPPYSQYPGSPVGHVPKGGSCC